MTMLSQTRADLLRWATCGAVVVMAHAGLAAVLVQRFEPPDTADVTAAIVLELAPISAAPAPMTEDIPPGPEMVQAEAAPEKPVEVAKLEEPLLEELKPQPEAEVELPPPEQKPEPPQPESAVPAPTTSAPQAVQMALASVPAAPTQAAPKLSDSTAIPTWRTRIAAALERNKRYPLEARQRRQQGVAQVAFTLDRKGQLLASHIVRGSGYASLDQETLQMLQRAQPFPPPPVELSGERVDLIVPVRFNLR